MNKLLKGENTMITQTLFYDTKDNLILRVDDIIYTPIDTIVIRGREYERWKIQDVFKDSDYLVRRITLVL